MEQGIKKTMIWIVVGAVLLLLLIIINQLLQIGAAASAIHPTLGIIVTACLAMVFLVAFLVPVIGFLKLRKPLELPDENDMEARSLYLQTLKARMVKNEQIVKSGYVFDESQDLPRQIEGALQILHQETHKVMNEASTQVFITTAVSQNGVLDGLFVMVSLSKMIWRISHIYNQRPNLKEMVYLYVNVAATVLMAREIEDLALLDEQLEPIINSLIGGTLSTLVPGATAVANIIVNSVIEGSANAFLTLRVGAMARRYSAATIKLDKRIVKRSSTLEACGLFGSIVQQNSMAVVKAFAMASKRATLDKTAGKISEGASKTTRFIKDIFKK